MSQVTPSLYTLSKFILFIEKNNISLKRELAYELTKFYPQYAKTYKYYHGRSVTSAVKSYGSTSIMNIIKNQLHENQSTNNSKESSIQRTKTAISDIAVCNEFDQFVTFTFNCKNCKYPCQSTECTITTPHKKEQCDKIQCNCPPELCKRLDPQECKKRMSNWLDNQRKNNKQLKYLITPEYHKQGGLHFHALIKHLPKRQLTPAINHYTRKKIINKGQQVYNLKSYNIGYTTLKIIGSTPEDIGRVSSYIKKYITKDMPEFPGSKRYWSSTNCIRPTSATRADVLNIPFVNHEKVYENPATKMQIYISDIKSRLTSSYDRKKRAGIPASPDVTSSAASPISDLQQLLLLVDVLPKPVCSPALDYLDYRQDVAVLSRSKRH